LFTGALVVVRGCVRADVAVGSHRALGSPQHDARIHLVGMNMHYGEAVRVICMVSCDISRVCNKLSDEFGTRADFTVFRTLPGPSMFSLSAIHSSGSWRLRDFSPVQQQRWVTSVDRSAVRCTLGPPPAPDVAKMIETGLGGNTQAAAVRLRTMAVRPMPVAC
jgi:hypothetical protein